MSAPTLTGNSLLKPLAFLLVGSIVAACSLANHPWRKADEYVEGLRCKMSETELRAYSEQYPQVELWDPNESDGFLVARKGNTQISLWLGASGLTAYQIAWTYPLTNFDSRLKTNLCSGTRYVDFNLVGDSELSGATVWLEGERVGELSSSGTFSRDVPLGVHQLRIEKVGVGSWSTELRYDESSSGYDRVPIPQDALRPR